MRNVLGMSCLSGNSKSVKVNRLKKLNFGLACNKKNFGHGYEFSSTIDGIIFSLVPLSSYSLHVFRYEFV